MQRRILTWVEFERGGKHLRQTMLILDPSPLNIELDRVIFIKKNLVLIQLIKSLPRD